jgi:hypothetical protein
MKKFIFTANVIAIIALVPAVVIGYLHNNDRNDDAKDKTVLVREATDRNDDGTTLHMVRTF